MPYIWKKYSKHLHFIRRISTDNFVNNRFIAATPLGSSFLTPVSEELFDGRPHLLHVKQRGRTDGHTSILCKIEKHGYMHILILLIHVATEYTVSRSEYMCK